MRHRASEPARLSKRRSRSANASHASCMTRRARYSPRFSSAWPCSKRPSPRRMAALVSPIRNLSIDLRPSALDDLGLLPALRWYIKEYQQKCSIEVEFHSAGFKGRLPAEIETALYRIVQESLTNTAKHANAHKVYIYLKEDADTVDATIIDDGSGFDLQALHKTAPQERGIGLERGLGLVGMEERAVLLNGSLTINSSRGHGTTVEVRIPLHSPDLSEKQAAPELAV